MTVYTVSIREGGYYNDLSAIFSNEIDANTYADRIRSLGHEVIVDPWAVNEELPEWDGEES